MRIHLRFDGTHGPHARLTLFVNGQNSGLLCMSPDEADWLYLALERGCAALSPEGTEPITFVGSGKHRDGEPIPPVPKG